MKQLKFMLAAATAISLATAAQAARFSGSTDFEGNFDLATGFTFNGTSGDNESAIVPGVPSNTVDGVLTELAEANRPANHGFTATRANILQVNTGTEPIVRNIDGGTDVVLNGGAVYIDTLVKFTVTPENDTVEPTKVDGVIQDKLMVYLRDEGDAGKNLYVVAGYYDAEDVLKYDSYLIKSNVDPDVWHRLVVKAIDDISGGVLGGKFPGFQIYLDGDAESNMCVSDSYMADMTGMFTPETGMFLSMKSAESTASSGLSSVTLTSVGFAGEGKVDDLVITTFDPSQTVVDFTLALDDAVGGINGAVTYSCGAASGELSGSVAVSCYVGDTVTVSYALKSETEYSASWTGATVTGNAFEVNADTAGDTITLVISKNAPSTVDFTFVTGTGVTAVEWTINGEAPAGKVKAGDVIKITSVDYVDLYVPGTVAAGYEKTITADEVAAGVAISVTVDAKPLTGDGAVVVPEGTTAAQIGVDTDTTGLADASATELTAIVKWADTFKTGTATAIETVNSMVFDGKEPKNEPAEAFLLNCSVADLATKKGEFKFVNFDASKVETWLQGAIDALKAEYPNGNVVPQRAQNLGAWYGDDDEKPEGFAPKFFRAKLIRK